ncbi:hypothetical protein SAMN02194393_05171 [Maledivibacter halophilus]|uniref:Uncharacterized protein n=1 Tax=Maledivibacter halophilus TaxID=36842 RepID=A0A1T5MQI1_9FIRM|nr:hypothetical protein SAMN02194393_05171 [Maledivibacter halophilus]
MVSRGIDLFTKISIILAGIFVIIGLVFKYGYNVFLWIGIFTSKKHTRTTQIIKYFARKSTIFISLAITILILVFLVNVFYGR